MQAFRQIISVRKGNFGETPFTDIPSMKLVNTYGGHAIGVYNPVTGNKEKVYRMMRDNRIRYFAPADYRKGQQLEQLIQTIIDKTAAYEKLEALHIDGLKEMKGQQ